MCGITGIATPAADTPIDRAMLEAMTDLLAHRGPDGRGFHSAPGIGLGMRRLSIVDLTTGEQPISNEAGSVLVVCNGEIYNAPELRQGLLNRGHHFRGHSDVEVVVHLYEEVGIECLHRLRGMFALAIWDGRDRTLFLARDRFGMKPLYHARAQDGTLFFASEAKSILFTGRVDRSLDPAGVSSLLHLGGPLFDRTVFKGIRQLEAGHWLSYRAGRIAIEKYWDLDFGGPRPHGLPRTEGEWSEAIAAKLRESVRIHLRGDVPVAGWLSAGIDSSAVVFLAAQELGGVFPTFSLGFDEPGLDELRHQRTLDQFPGQHLSGERVRFGGFAFESLATSIWHQEQPVHLQPSWQALGAAMSGRFKVALTGQGSDEMLGGYPWYKTDRMWTPLYRLPVAVRRTVARTMPRISENDRRAISGPPEMNFQRYSSLHWSRWNELRALFQPDFQREEALAGASLELPSVPAGFHEWDRFQQLLYIEAKTRLPSYINLGLDASSMAKSVEPRLPFLDHEFAELCMHLPPRLRHRRMEKHILRMAMEPFLPPEILWREKRGLRSPDPSWPADRGAAPELAREMLADDTVRSKGYFRPGAVRALVSEGTGVSATLAAVVGFHLLDTMLVEGRGLPA
jgi:asparagine synthase (glutamine-hydrolysing)